MNQDTAHTFVVIGGCSNCMREIKAVVNAPSVSAAQGISLGASCTACVAGTLSYIMSTTQHN